jgi:hypothetical protein
MCFRVWGGDWGWQNDSTNSWMKQQSILWRAPPVLQGWWEGAVRSSDPILLDLILS